MKISNHKMENEKKSTASIKKAFVRSVGRTQKMVSFRLDNDLIERLNQEPNKGRLINNLLREYFGED